MCNHLSTSLLRLVLFFVIFFKGVVASAQSEDKFYLTWHSADDNSLPQNSIKSIIQDKHGYVWLSTENGLVRYDGSRFKVYGTDQMKGLQTNRMTSFRGSVRNDSLYMLNDDGDMILMSSGTPTLTSSARVPKIIKVRRAISSGQSIMEEKIYNRDGSFYHLQSDKIQLNTNAGKAVWGLRHDYEDTRAFFLLNNTLYRFKNGSFTSYAAGHPRNFTIDHIDSTVSLISNPIAQQAFFIRGDYIWLAGGTGSQGEEPLRPRHLIEVPGLASLNIISAYYDGRNDIIYLGSSTQGLLIARKKQFRAVRGSKGNGVYYAQLPLTPSTFLTASGEIFDSSGKVREIGIPFDSDKYSLMMSSTGDIWTKAGNKVYRFNSDSQYKTYSQWNFDDRATQIFQMRDGRVIVGISVTGEKRGKYYLLDGSPRGTLFRLHMNVKFHPTCMLEREDNMLWAGSNTGLHRIAVDSRKVIDIASVSNTYVRSLYSDNRDRIWAGTYDRGLLLYETSKGGLTEFPFDKNRYLRSAHCIIEDRSGHFWISTNKGLFKIFKMDLLRYSKGEVAKIYYHYYDKTDGFLTNEFNGGCEPCALSLEDGHISFPSMKGNVIFRPETVTMLLPDGEIYFDEAQLDGARLAPMGDNVEIDQGFERFALYISSPYFGNPNNMDIEVKFDGPVRQNWTRLSGDNFSFTSLPPGSYTVSVRKLTGSGSDYRTKSLHLLVRPAFYQTWTFLILAALLALLLLAYTVKMRLEYMRRKNVLLENKIDERTSQLSITIATLRDIKEDLSTQIATHKRLLATITHDIKSPLRFLATTGEHLYEKKSRKGDIDETIKSFYTSSLQLYNFVDNLLEYSKISEDSISMPFRLQVLVDEKIQIFLPLAAAKKIQIENRIGNELAISSSRLVVSIIVHNLLDNAVKNTDSGSIIFRAYEKKDAVDILIEDTGRGMPQHLVALYNGEDSPGQGTPSQDSGIGLPMISDLLVIVDAWMQIKIAPSGGTIIILSFRKKA